MADNSEGCTVNGCGCILIIAVIAIGVWFGGFLWGMLAAVFNAGASVFS